MQIYFITPIPETVMCLAYQKPHQKAVVVTLIESQLSEKMAVSLEPDI